jgi:hypothetical protein
VLSSRSLKLIVSFLRIVHVHRYLESELMSPFHFQLHHIHKMIQWYHNKQDKKTEKSKYFVKRRFFFSASNESFVRNFTTILELYKYLRLKLFWRPCSSEKLPIFNNEFIIIIILQLNFPNANQKVRGLVIMVFNATFNNISFISLRSVLLVEETGVPDLSQVTDKLCFF